ncbi:MAG: hypothetical protein LIO92_09455 [Clostridiales bacterium]|nr:hypothetical protein [Clostridiales bacterium]
MNRSEEIAVAILHELMDTSPEEIPQIRQELLEAFQNKPALMRFIKTAFSLIEERL